MQNHIKLGINRTGTQMAPRNARQMVEGTQHVPPSSEGDASALALLRGRYIAEADALGSVPIPASLRGAWESGKNMLSGRRPQVLVDKLGERLAFERGGTRLYEAMLAKAEAAPGVLPDGSLVALRRFRDDEERHFLQVAEAIQSLGADPTAMTPCADLVGMQNAGLVQVLTDPRTTLAQCLNALLTAEMADHAGWEILIVLAEKLGQEPMAARFTRALEQETHHQAQLRQWYEQAVLSEALQRPVRASSSALTH